MWTIPTPWGVISFHFCADELRMPKENSNKEIVLVNRIGEHPILEVDVCIGCRKCERECPTRCIDMLDGPNDRKGKPIVIPEFVPAQWWHHLLHNQRALLIKGALLFRPNVVVTSVPFHLNR